MQGQILTTDSTRNIILGDDGVRYTFISHDWQSEDKEPEVGMRVDFEVQGSEAVDIYPIPGAASTPPSQQSSPGPSTTGGSSAQPRTGSPADERFKERLRQTHRELETRYDPIRERIGNYGAIGVGIVLLTLGAFIRFNILETLLDIMAMLGMLFGAALTAIGVFMLGKEEGWWDGSSESSGSLVAGAGPAPKPREVSQEPPKDPPAAAPMRPAQSSDTPPPRQTAPVERQSIDITRAQYPSSAAAYESGTTVRAGQPQRADSEEIPTKLMLALAIVPVVLLILTLLPITPWFTHEARELDHRERWTGEYTTAYETLWNTISQIRDLESGDRYWSLVVEWEGPLGALALTIVGAVALAIAMFMYRQSNQKLRYPPEENEAFNDRLDLFLSVSILICGLTLLSGLLAWYYIELGPLVFSGFGDSGGYSLGPLLFVLAMLSIVGFLVSLAANETTRSRFLRIDISTFVSFKGRVRRPTFALITAPMHFQNLIGICATLYLLAVIVPLPLDLEKYLLAPYGILIDSAEQHSPVFLSFISPAPGLFSTILLVAILYLWLALCVKRYHDLDKSGWWVLVSFIPNSWSHLDTH